MGSPDTVLAFLDADVILGTVREIAPDDKTSWDHIIDFDVAEVQKALGGDEAGEPMFVEVDVLYVGQSRKEDGSENIGYSEKTVRETAGLLPGTIAYLGHQDPKKRDFEYRVPVGKYVAGRVVTKDVPNVGRVPVAVGKCYVSAAAKTFRTHVKEQLAGPVSIHGTAAFKAEHGRRTNQTVGMRRLKSVDFCNPGTPGMKEAGVTAVVREIANSSGSEPEGAPKMPDAVKFSSVSEMQAAYPDLCKFLIQQEVSSYEKTVSEMRDRAETAEGKVETLEGEVEEQKKRADDAEKAHKEATERADKAEGIVKEQAAKVRVAAVEKALAEKIDSRIAAAKEGESGTQEAGVLEMARKQFGVSEDHIVADDDDDNTLSLKKAEAAFDTQVGSVREMAKSMGFQFSDAPIKDVSEIAGGGTTSTGNPKRTSGEDRFKSLLPAYKRQSDGWKSGDDK